MSDTVFDAIAYAFKSVLESGTPVCNVIELDESEEIADGLAEAVAITPASAVPDRVGGIEGNPVEWSYRVRLELYASARGASARVAANDLFTRVYARLAADPSLGLGAGVYIGDPAVDWSQIRRVKRYACCDLYYTVRCRTGGATLTLE